MAECSLSDNKEEDIEKEISWMRNINVYDSDCLDDELDSEDLQTNKSSCSLCGKVLCLDKSTSVTDIDTCARESIISLSEKTKASCSSQSILQEQIENGIDNHSSYNLTEDIEDEDVGINNDAKPESKTKPVSAKQKKMLVEIMKETNRRNLVDVSEVNLPSENVHIENRSLNNNSRHPFRRTLSNSIIEVPTFANRLEPQFLEAIQFPRDIHLPNNPEMPEDIFLWGERRPVVPSYPQGERKFTECLICYDLKELHLRVCCHLAACDSCLTQYFSTQVSQGITKIQCLQPQCTQFVHRDEILGRLSGDVKDKFYRFLVDANKDPKIKTCPRCSHITNVNTGTSKPNLPSMGVKVICAECDLVWCFPCQAPWHEGVTCKDYIRGDKLLRNWAKEFHYGQQNAQKCPKCKVYIQRTTGCDHMSCSRCGTHFCYRCGERYRQLKFVGDHYGKLSILGCKFRFKPDKPVQRKFIRGSLFGGKLAVLPVVGGVALGVGAVLLAFGVLVLPFYGSFRLHKRLQRKKRLKVLRKARDEMRKRLDLEYMQEKLRRGDNVEISCPMSYPEDLEDLDEMFGTRPKYNINDRHLSMTVRLDTVDEHSSVSSDSEDDCDVTVTEVKVITERVKDKESEHTPPGGSEVKLSRKTSSTDDSDKPDRKLDDANKSDNDTASLDRIVEDMMKMTEDINASKSDVKDPLTADNTKVYVNQKDEMTAL